jgi:hypothetical protein
LEYALLYAPPHLRQSLAIVAKKWFCVLIKLVSATGHVDMSTLCGPLTAREPDWTRQWVGPAHYSQWKP